MIITDNIINEEINKIICEGYVFENENLKFKDIIRNPTFYNYSTFSSNYNVEIGESNMNINWHIGFWLNDSGIENFTIIIDGVDGIYNVELFDKHTDELVQQNSKNIQEINWKYIIDNNTSLLKGGVLYVQSVIFDFSNNTCNVTFQ